MVSVFLSLSPYTTSYGYVRTSYTSTWVADRSSSLLTSPTDPEHYIASEVGILYLAADKNRQPHNKPHNRQAN